MMKIMTDTNFSVAIKIAKFLKEDKVSCHGFVEFAESATAARVISEGKVKIASKEVSVEYVRPGRRFNRYRGYRPRTFKQFILRVSGYPEDLSPKDVMKSFQDGKIKYVSRDKGFLLVNFDSAEKMNKALKENQGKVLGGKKIDVETVRINRSRGKVSN